MMRRVGTLLLLLLAALAATAVAAEELEYELDVVPEEGASTDMPPAMGGSAVGGYSGEVRSAVMGDDTTMTAHDGPPKGKFGVHLEDHKNHPELKRYYDWKGAHDEGRKMGAPTAHLGAFAGKIDPDYLHHIVRDMHKEEL